MKFRVGQRVELIDNNSMVAPIGATAIVERVGVMYIYVAWEADFNGQMNGGYPSHWFKPSSVKGEQLEFSFMR